MTARWQEVCEQWEEVKQEMNALRDAKPIGGSKRIDEKLGSDLRTYCSNIMAHDGFSVGLHIEHVENADNTKDYFASPESFTVCTYTIYWGDQIDKGVRTDSTTSLSAAGYRARRSGLA